MSITFRIVFVLILWLTAAGLTAAQDYPTKPIKVVIPNAPGTVADLMLRIMGPEMSKHLGQPIIVENKPGANQLIGYDYVAKQPPDGYTLVTVSVGTLAMMPMLVKDLRFDPLKDLPPIFGFMQGRLYLATSSEHPWKSFDELVAYAKANPGKLNYGSNSAATRVPTEMVLQQRGVSAVHIPYPSSAAYNKAMASGELHMGILGPGDVATLGERIRILAVTGSKRSALHRNVPTFAELGFPQIPGAIFSLNGPAGLPPQVASKLFHAASQALLEPSVQAQFAKLHADIEIETSDVASKRLASVAKVYGDVIQKVGLKPE